MVARTRRAKALVIRSDGLGSSQAHADDELLKIQLVKKIAKVIDDMGYSQCEAASRLGLPQPKLSKLVRGQLHGVSARKLIECITRLGHDVEIVVRPSAVQGKHGSVSVVFS